MIMEKLLKLEACSSLSQSKGSFVENRNKISNLPTHIAHHILSFLMMEDIARLSIVSKWWHALCISIPSLTVDDMRYRGKDYKLIHFKNFLDRLMLRCNGMKMVQFCVRWTFLDWSFKNATLCFALRIVEVSSNEFAWRGSPTAVLNSLDKLCLDAINGINNINIWSSSLKYLEIRSYEHDDLFHLNVSGELLEELIIHWKFTPSGVRSLEMATPLLKCFTWGGFAPDNCLFGNLKCLHYCALSLEQLSSSWKPPYLEFFRILEPIEELVIHAQCLKYAMQFDDVELVAHICKKKAYCG
ncbi:hypothetical protein FH972_017622 [Carpinus fangiana]|uniref:F-box domain-containing protein n=1 Tax=Carpinus fangiana TaxID=176857 RepID=A0A5N6RNE3_9ROSI|nr:hypothetical protein FH972_017622 [Carpinus fangiana]